MDSLPNFYQFLNSFDSISLLDNKRFDIQSQEQLPIDKLRSALMQKFIGLFDEKKDKMVV